MLKRFTKSVLLIALAATLIACSQSENTNKTSKETEVSKTVTAKKLKVTEDKQLVIMHLNDTHGRVEEGKYDGMGYARVKTLVDEQRAENKNVLLLDAGDTIHGTVFAALSRGESVVDIMNTMEYTAMAPGNHDFNYGLDRLEELEDKMNFEILASNVEYKTDGNTAFKPYIIKEIDGMKIGILGVSTPETAYKTNPTNVEAVTFTNPIATAAKAVEDMSNEGVNYIIAISHLGMDEDSYYTSIRLAEEIDGIDLIVDGHSHTTLKNGLQIKDTLIVQTGFYDKNLGRVEIAINKDGSTNAIASLISKEFALENTAKDKGVEETISNIKVENNKITEVVVGHTDINLDGERNDVRTGETNLGKLLTTSMLAKTGADVAITNGGGIRASITEGDITKGDVISVLPFGNYVVVLDVTGQDIIDAVENGIQSYPNARGAFPHIAGMIVKFNPSQPAFERVEDITLSNGEKLDPTKTYTLATNDFMAVGGDEYASFKGRNIAGEYETLEEILSNYIGENGTALDTSESRLLSTK